MPILCVSMSDFHAGCVSAKRCHLGFPPLVPPSVVGASLQSVIELYPDTDLESQINAAGTQNNNVKKIEDVWGFIL